MHLLKEEGSVATEPVANARRIGARRAKTLPRRTGIRYLVRQLGTSLPLLLSDVLAIILIVWVATRMIEPDSARLASSLLPYLCAAIVVAFALSGLYPAIGLHPAVELKNCSIATTTVFATGLCFWLATAEVSPWPAFIVGLSWILILMAVPFVRSAARQLSSRFDFWTQPVLIFGDVTRGAEIFREMHGNRRCGLRPLGIIADNASQWLEAETDPDIGIATAEKATSIANYHRVYWAVIVSESGHFNGEAEHIEECLAGIPHRLYIDEELRQNGVQDAFVE